MPAKKSENDRPAYFKRTDKKPVQVWLSSEDREKIMAAAELDMRPMTEVLLRGGLEYADKILGKSQKKR